MTEFLPLIDDPHAIHVCFHRILDTLVKSDSTHAWEVLKRMEAAKVPPNNVTCSILLKGVHKEMKDGRTRLTWDKTQHKNQTWTSVIVVEISQCWCCG